MMHVLLLFRPTLHLLELYSATLLYITIYQSRVSKRKKKYICFTSHKHKYIFHYIVKPSYSDAHARAGRTHAGRQAHKYGGMCYTSTLLLQDLQPADRTLSLLPRQTADAQKIRESKKISASLSDKVKKRHRVHCPLSLNLTAVTDEETFQAPAGRSVT